MQYQPSGSAPQQRTEGNTGSPGLCPGAYIIAAIYNKPVSRGIRDNTNEVARPK